MTKRVADVTDRKRCKLPACRGATGIVGDTLNQIAHAIGRVAQSNGSICGMRRPGRFAAGAEAQLTGWPHRLRRLRAVQAVSTSSTGSTRPIATVRPSILIASQIMRQDLGFDSIQEVDFVDVYKRLQRFLRDDSYTGAGQAKRTVAACQAALTRGGVAVLVVPVDVAQTPPAHDEPAPMRSMCGAPLVRPSDADLDEIAGHSRQDQGNYHLRRAAGLRRRPRRTKWSPRPRGVDGANGAQRPVARTSSNMTIRTMSE